MAHLFKLIKLKQIYLYPICFFIINLNTLSSQVTFSTSVRDNYVGWKTVGLINNKVIDTTFSGLMPFINLTDVYIVGDGSMNQRIGELGILVYKMNLDTTGFKVVKRYGVTILAKKSNIKAIRLVNAIEFDRVDNEIVLNIKYGIHKRKIYIKIEESELSNIKNIVSEGFYKALKKRANNFTFN